MRTLLVTAIMALALGAVSGGNGLQQPGAPAPAPAPTQAAIKIASVTPKSVVAGASFSVAVQLPDDYKQSITIAVHRVGLNLEQYRSAPLRDNDVNDAAPETGVIIHRVPTDVKWTSAQTLTNTSANDSFMVSIEDPIVLQVNQLLTVVRTALNVDANTVQGWLENLYKGVAVYQELGRRANTAENRGMYSMGRTEAVIGDPRGATYFLSDSPGADWNTAYFRTPDLFGGLPRSVVAPNAGAGIQFPTQLLLRLQQAQQQELKGELDSVQAAIQALSPAARGTTLRELQSLQQMIQGTAVVR